MNHKLLQQALDQLYRTQWALNCEASYLLDPVVAILEAELAKPDKFIDICIDRKYVIRNYKSIITDIGIFCEFTLDEWNEHAKNIRELCEPEQKPVAYYWRDTKACYWIADIPLEDLANLDVSPLYTAPPRKEWVGLTDEEIKNILDCGRGGLVDIKKAEAKLKEKNT